MVVETILGVSATLPITFGIVGAILKLKGRELWGMALGAATFAALIALVGALISLVSATSPMTIFGYELATTMVLLAPVIVFVVSLITFWLAVGVSMGALAIKDALPK